VSSSRATRSWSSSSPLMSREYSRS
jgi:hypothetical protein